MNNTSFEVHDPEITNEGVIEAAIKAKGCSNITSVNLSGCPKLTDEGVIKVVKIFPNLTSVNLSGCYLITNASVIKVAENCTGITLLDLSWCRNITIKSVIKLAQCCLQLSKLILSGCSGVEDREVRFELGIEITSFQFRQKITDDTIEQLKLLKREVEMYPMTQPTEECIQEYNEAIKKFNKKTDVNQVSTAAAVAAVTRQNNIDAWLHAHGADARRNNLAAVRRVREKLISEATAEMYPMTQPTEEDVWEWISKKI